MPKLYGLCIISNSKRYEILSQTEEIRTNLINKMTENMKKSNIFAWLLKNGLLLYEVDNYNNSYDKDVEKLTYEYIKGYFDGLYKSYEIISQINSLSVCE